MFIIINLNLTDKLGKNKKKKMKQTIWKGESTETEKK